MSYGLTQSADIEQGSSQGFSRADNSLLDETIPFTIELWANFESFPSGDSQIMIKKTAGGANGYAFRYQVVAGQHKLNLVKCAVVDQDVNISSLSTGTWYHIAAVQTSTQVEYFIDGTSVGTFTNSSSYVSSGTNDVTIGTVDGAGGTNFDGKMSLVRFWQTNRTGTQISDNMCSVLGSTTSLSAEWTLDNTLNDNSGNSFTLTNTNSTPFVSDVPSVCGGGSTPVRSSMLLMGV